MRTFLTYLIFLSFFLLFSFLWSDEEPLLNGHQLFKQGKYALARDSYLKAVVTNPLQGECLLYLGHTYIVLQSYKKAEYCLRRSLDLISNVDFPMDLKTFFSTEDALMKVCKQLQTTLNTQPESVRLRILLSYFYFFSGERERAKLLFYELIQHSKEDRFARFFIERINREEQKRILLLSQETTATEILTDPTLEKVEASTVDGESCVSESESLSEKIKRTSETESFSKEKTKNTFSH